MATRKLEVIITGDASSLEKALGKASGQGRSFAKTMGKAGVAGAIVGLGAAVKIGVSEFIEAQKVTAQTNAVIKSTGGVANVSAAEVGKLSEALMRKSGVDDEAIASGQNMLLTFTKVRNEVGAGNDVFNQATKATLDLSVAMGKDMQSSAILVGKALNDPIKGVTALTRAGVQFDEQQRATIKQMVAAGNTMGAQKIILKELETQFGGSAEAAGKTFGGQVNIAKERMTNFAGELVTKSIPVLQSLMRTINEDVIPALRGMWRWVSENIIPTFQTMWVVVRDAWQGIAKVLKENEPELRRILGLVQDIGQMALWLVNKVVLPVLKPMLTKVLPEALNVTIEALDKVVAVVDKIISGFKWIGDNASSIFGKVSGALGKLPGVGDAFDPRMVMPPGTGVHGLGNLRGARPEMAPFAAAAAAHGLVVTSGLRPGAITANGTPSDHGIGKALDVAGSPAGMASFFRSLIGNRLVKQAFYDPLGSIFGGALSSYREGGHSDHVHVATYDRGGALRPGWNLAYNGLGRNEALVAMPTGGGGDIVIQVDGETLARVNRRYAEKHARRNTGV